jgi:hypothetical protein
VVAPSQVFPHMRIPRKQSRATRLLASNESSTFAHNQSVPITATMTLAPSEETGALLTVLVGSEIERYLFPFKQEWAGLRRAELENILQRPIRERLPLVVEHVGTFTDSYSRMAEVLAFKDRMTSHDWLRLVGGYWSVCDNIRHYRLPLRKILGTNGPLRQMMSPEENSHYDSLPGTITCYRGCDASVLVGASWTLDKETAKKFPTYARYRAPDPVLITATVKRANVLSVQLRRGEEELITFSARRVAVETGRWTLDGRILWPAQEAA